jgi:CheY-like chemotaxis protein
MPHTVLCVEDNDANMLVIERISEVNNYKLIKAADAEEGIQLAREHMPDLILMDINLPGIDGLTATRLIKQDAAIAHIPIIAVTASSAISVQECLSAGCADHIAKPITIAKLMLVMRKYKL